MAHYYFGTALVATGAYRWFFNESMTEYLALKAIEHRSGQPSLADWIRRHLQNSARSVHWSRLDELEAAGGSPSDRYDYLAASAAGA